MSEFNLDFGEGLGLFDEVLAGGSSMQQPTSGGIWGGITDWVEGAADKVGDVLNTGFSVLMDYDRYQGQRDAIRSQFAEQQAPVDQTKLADQRMGRMVPWVDNSVLLVGGLAVAALVYVGMRK